MSDIIKKFVTLKDGSKLFYASERSVRNEAKDFVGEIVGINGPSDLEAGVYEGGLKVWECSVDLCNFLLTNYSTMTGIDVLELGCGAALPSIVALRKAANSICVQDFNSFVVECFTKKNFELNGVKSDGEKCTFVGGEWGADIAGKIGPKKFNLILTSETIYNEFNYASLHHTMDSLLTDDGKVLLAAKAHYFGVGGSVLAFSEFVRSRGTFASVEEVWSTKTSSIPRKILSLSRKMV
uniref:protein-histidine N-methyltransferase n=1 Tax=Globodera rostochiensis TaxID=31243 RepID=A0A914HA89_GLORO